MSNRNKRSNVAPIKIEEILARKARGKAMLCKMRTGKESLSASESYAGLVSFFYNNLLINEGSLIEDEISSELYLIGYISGLMRVSYDTFEHVLLKENYSVYPLQYEKSEFSRLIKIGYEDGLVAQQAKSVEVAIEQYSFFGGLIPAPEVPYSSEFYQDSNLADMAAELIKGQYVLSGDKSLLVYDGGIWVEKPDRAVLKSFSKTFLKELKEELKAWPNLPNSAEKMKSQLGSIRKIFDVATTLENDLPRSTDIVFDEDPLLIVTPSRTLHLVKNSRGKFTIKPKKHSPYDYATIKANADFSATPNYNNEIFKKIIGVVPEEEREWLQVHYGSGLLGISNTAFLSITSPGGSGKTFFNDCVSEVTGSLSVNLSKYIFEDNPQGERARSRVKKARMGFIDEWGSFSETIMKQFVGNESVNVRSLFKEEETIKLGMTFVSTSNELPPISKVTDALERRLYRLIFPYKFVAKPNKNNPLEKKIEPDLFARFREDIEAQEALLSWLLQGSVNYLNNTAWQEENLTKGIDEATKEWLNEGTVSTKVLELIEETGERKDVIFLKDLYKLTKNTFDIGDLTERHFVIRVKSEGILPKSLISEPRKRPPKGSSVIHLIPGSSIDISGDSLPQLQHIYGYKLK